MEMSMLFYAGAITTMLVLYLLHRSRRCCKSPLSTDWPILGMLPQFLYNAWRINDFIADVLNQEGGTVEFMGPWFTKMDYVFTSDPMNAHHILIKNFDNYVKGPQFRETFKPFGDGIVTSDSETWRYMRSMYHFLFKQKSFETLVEKTIQHKMEHSLLPILDHVQQQGAVVDLQDVFCRLAFDAICSNGLGYDPNCLSIEFPFVAAEKAFDEVQECIMYRHIVPKCVWKLQEWLQIGKEKELVKSCKVFEQFLHGLIASKRQELSKCNRTEVSESHSDLLSALSREEKYSVEANDDKFLRDSGFNLFVAGRDTLASTLTWFFWLVATNPSVEAKILEEIKDNFGASNGSHKVLLGKEEVNKLVYLHGALCETLRLFPPIPLERKQPVKFDILPSGHRVNPNMQIIFSFYAMGRSKEIWGQDCLEFKPKRWISDNGDIIRIPSYKFISFNAGPRTCLGKELSFIQLKMVITAVLSNYQVQLVEGYQVIPTLSIILLMKHGLKVRIIKREL